MTGDGSVWRRREVDGGSGRRVAAAEEVAAEAGGVVGRREMAASGDGERLKGAPGGGRRVPEAEEAEGRRKNPGRTGR